MTRGGMLEVGVEQDQRERALVGMAEQIGVAHLPADDLRHFLHGPVVGRDHHAFPFAAGLDDDERQEVLGPHGALELAVEHELERAGRQQLRALFVERTAGHGL